MDKLKLARRILLPLPGDIIRTVLEVSEEKREKINDQVIDFCNRCDNCQSADEAKDICADYNKVVKKIGTKDKRNVECLTKMSNMSERFNVPEIGEMRRIWISAMDNLENYHEYKKGLDRTNNLFFRDIADNFIDKYEFGKRQFIYLSDNDGELAGCIDKYNHIQWAFSLDRRPSDMKFYPSGHPLPYNLYAAHPVKKGLYLPYELAEDIIFNDKVEDYFILLQCLGATHITARSIKGHRISRDIASDLEIRTKGGYGLIIGEGNGKVKGSCHTNTETNNSTEWSWEFSPLRKPFVPDGLVWLEHEPEWQKMVKARTEGNATKWTKRISSSESSCINVNTYAELDSSFRFFLVKAHGDGKGKFDYSRKSHEETIWEISADFRPVEDFE